MSHQPLNNIMRTTLIMWSEFTIRPLHLSSAFNMTTPSVHFHYASLTAEDLLVVYQTMLNERQTYTNDNANKPVKIFAEVWINGTWDNRDYIAKLDSVEEYPAYLANLEIISYAPSAAAHL